jgi:triosephosphate isomerase
LRRPLIAGNWKMYKTQAGTHSFFEKFLPLLPQNLHCDVMVAPPFTALASAVDAAGKSSVAIAGQNLFWEREGAFTGEISAEMLVAVGAKAVIIGHSERRQYFGETDETVHRKIKAALNAGLLPVVCVGETLVEREATHTETVLARQCEGAFHSLTDDEFSRIVIAYEPVWAIGTGRTATPEIASDAHSHIRAMCVKHFGAEQANGKRILYGGSVKPDNIKGLMAQPDIDGALVGGASLDPQSFAAIVNY